MPRKNLNQPEPTDNPEEVRIYEVIVSMIPYDLRGQQHHRKQGEQVASVEFVGNERRTPESIEKHFVNLGAIALINTCTRSEWNNRDQAK